MNQGKSKVLLFVLMVLTVISLGSTVFLYMNRSRMAYLRSPELVEGYLGTKEARVEFERRRKIMLSNVDSMSQDFERSQHQYQSTLRRLSTEQRSRQEQELRQQYSQLLQYREAIDLKIEEEDDRIMQEVLNQINSYVEEFAQREGYSVILGTTASGSLLYGEKSMDVTEQVLQELNNKYQGK